MRRDLIITDTSSQNAAIASLGRKIGAPCRAMSEYRSPTQLIACVHVESCSPYLEGGSHATARSGPKGRRPEIPFRFVRSFAGGQQGLQRRRKCGGHAM